MHFCQYVEGVNEHNLHPNKSHIYKRHFPQDITHLKNLIFYGPPGTGKYSQLLSAIEQYSPSSLKYEKRMNITYNGKTHLFKMSDIHFEVDMALLGCNSKLIWHEIYQHMLEILTARPDSRKVGIVVCKNMHDIHTELLDNFYSYMQKNTFFGATLIFMFLTEHVSFLPDNIQQCCAQLSFGRPSKTRYQHILNHRTLLPPLHEITNVKVLTDLLNIPRLPATGVIEDSDPVVDPGDPAAAAGIACAGVVDPSGVVNPAVVVDHCYFKLMTPHYCICSNIAQTMWGVALQHSKETKETKETKENTTATAATTATTATTAPFSFIKFREMLYDIFVYHLCVGDCIWHILWTFVCQTHHNSNHCHSKPFCPLESNQKMSNILLKTFTFLQYYNNNYRPIYHIEKYMFEIVLHL
jgi:hypothetical protein